MKVKQIIWRQRRQGHENGKKRLEKDPRSHSQSQMKSNTTHPRPSIELLPTIKSSWCLQDANHTNTTKKTRLLSNTMEHVRQEVGPRTKHIHVRYIVNLSSTSKSLRQEIVSQVQEKKHHTKKSWILFLDSIEKIRLDVQGNSTDWFRIERLKNPKWTKQNLRNRTTPRLNF